MKRARVLVAPNRYEVRDVPDDYEEPPAPPAIRAAATGPVRVSLLCEYDGPVVEPCRCGGGMRDVRMCLHPNPSDPDRDTCTRGRVSGKVQSCADCPDRVVAAG